MTQIHYKSDFDFIFELEGGFPTFNFGGKITSGVSEAVYFTFNCINKKCKNCFNDNGKIHVVCDKHGLPPGKLMLELYAYLPNSLYPDGERTIVCKTPIDIELTRSGCTEPIETPQIEVVIPYAVIDAYRLAVANGYEGTQEEYYAALNELPQVVDEAKDVTVEADAAADNANQAADRTYEATTQTIIAAQQANQAASFADAQGHKALASAVRLESAVEDATQRLEHCAVTNANNNFAAPQTFNGDVVINGNLVQNGESYVSYAEKVSTKQAVIVTREGAVGGMSEDEYSGIEAHLYDGEHNGVLAFGADGEARVGDKGDTQPLLTRAERNTMTNGALLKWNAELWRAETIPTKVVEMEVTYEDNTTETFNLIALL